MKMSTDAPTRDSDWIGHDWQCQTLPSENTENVQSTETWKRDRVISPNDSFWQRTAKSVSAMDVKTEFLNMEIAHINYVSKERELLTTEVYSAANELNGNDEEAIEFECKKIPEQHYRS